MTAMRLKRYPSPSGGIALGKMGVGATMLRQGKTARDYVQSGLVFLYDGIENDGWQTNNPLPSTWKDLIGGLGDIPIINASYANDHYHWDSEKTDSVTSVPKPTIDGINVLEVVAAATSLGGAGVSFITMRGGSGRRKLMAYVNGRRQSEITGNIFGFSFTPIVNTAYTYSGNFNAPSLHVNGTMQTQTTTIATWGVDSNNDVVFGGYYSGCNIYCVRGYSRALTADEIAANYAIDKARFGLP